MTKKETGNILFPIEKQPQIIIFLSQMSNSTVARELVYFEICESNPSEYFFYCQWRNLLFILLSIITLPLYLFIWIVVLKCRLQSRNSEFQATFYSVMLSQVRKISLITHFNFQGIADILAMVFYLFGTVLRLMNIGIPIFLAFPYASARVVLVFIKASLSFLEEQNSLIHQRTGADRMLISSIFPAFVLITK